MLAADGDDHCARRREIRKQWIASKTECRIFQNGSITEFLAVLYVNGALLSMCYEQVCC